MRIVLPKYIIRFESKVYLFIRYNLNFKEVSE